MDNVKKLRTICDELLQTDKEAALALDGVIELIECKQRLEEGTERSPIISGGEVLYSQETHLDIDRIIPF